MDSGDFNIFEKQGWSFYHKKQGMSNSKEMEILSEQAETKLPEVFYGKNRFYAVFPQKNFLLEIDPVETVSFSQFEKREKSLRTSTEPVVISLNDTAFDITEVVPAPIEVLQSAIWKKKDVSKIKDFQTIEQTSDWTFSTAFKGGIRFL